MASTRVGLGPSSTHWGLTFGRFASMDAACGKGTLTESQSQSIVIVAIAALENIEAGLVRAAIPVFIIEANDVRFDAPCAGIQLVTMPMFRPAIGMRGFGKRERIDFGALKIICPAMRFPGKSLQQFRAGQWHFLGRVGIIIPLLIGGHPFELCPCRHSPEGAQ